MHLFRITAGLLALASFVQTPALAQCPNEEDCVNRRDPGSLLLFPEYRNGPGSVTLLTVTNANCEFDGEVTVEFKFINGSTCNEANDTQDLTPCDTYSRLVTPATSPGEGFFWIFAKSKTQNSFANPAGNPIVFNHLIGSQLVVDAWEGIDYSVNAISFEAFGNEGENTDRENPGEEPDGPGDGIRDLDGVEYERAPERILIPRFLGQDPVAQMRGLHSNLILINLSGGVQFTESALNNAGGTTVLIHGWNDNEKMFSLEHTFSCWEKTRLGYLQSEDVEGMVPGTTVFDNSTLAATDNDPNEIVGGMGLESGWFWVNGFVANSTVESIIDPAIYAVLIETVRGKSAADLPFELCAQDNGDLLPNNLRGDYNGALMPPGRVVGDNQ